MICSDRCPHYIKGMCFKKTVVKVVRAGDTCKVELEKERAKSQQEAERNVNLIATVKENFAKVSKSAKVRVDCQQFFQGTELYDVVKWRYNDEHERKTNKLSLQHTL